MDSAELVEQIKILRSELQEVKYAATHIDIMLSEFRNQLKIIKTDLVDIKKKL